MAFEFKLPVSEAHGLGRIQDADGKLLSMADVVWALNQAEAYADVLRVLASFLQAGGFNAPDPISASEFEAKIRWGIDEYAKQEHARGRAEMLSAVLALLNTQISYNETARDRQFRKGRNDLASECARTADYLRVLITLVEALKEKFAVDEAKEG